MKKKLHSVLMCLVLIAASNVNASTDEVAETLSHSWWQSFQTTAGSVWDSGSGLVGSALNTVKPAWNATGLDSAWDTVCSGVSTVYYDDPYYTREILVGAGALLTGAYVVRRILTSDKHKETKPDTSSDAFIAKLLAKDGITKEIQKLKEKKNKTENEELAIHLTHQIANLVIEIAYL